MKVGSNALNYGMKENKLARSLMCTKEEALDLMNAYKERYPAVSKFYDKCTEELLKTGYSFTVLGRRRYHPQIHSGNTMDQWSAERQATNNTIQGSAADVVRLAMINIDNAGLDCKYNCQMLLQVHDELGFECPRETSEQARDEIKELMEHPFPTDLAVALDVSIGIGLSWDKAK